MLLPVAASGHAGTSAAASGAHPASSAWASNIWMGTASSGAALTLADVRGIIGANTGAAASLTGAGVGVALIDTGVAPVPGLPAAQVVNGPDLSFESQSAALRYLDTYGHGTHMAGIIVANDTATGTVGLAPKAKLTSIKVGTSNGAVDVSQMIAAIDWVVAHRNDDPANPIRVINLSYGSGGTPNYWTDPVQFAAEQAWKAGIVVVAAVGNGGGSMTDPATDQFVLNAGSANTNGTASTADDTISTFTNLTFSGGANRRTDVLAPGQSIVSLSDPGSNIDTSYPTARVGTTLFRGSGTSQATAVTSAAAALLLQARPDAHARPAQKPPDVQRQHPDRRQRRRPRLPRDQRQHGAGRGDADHRAVLRMVQRDRQAGGRPRRQPRRAGQRRAQWRSHRLGTAEHGDVGARERDPDHLVGRAVDGLPAGRQRLDRHVLGVEDVGVGDLVRGPLGRLEQLGGPGLVRPRLVRPRLVQRNLEQPLLVQ